ncbi:MAG: hypothetical protein OEO20_12030 [Gemmatimonadota bacterium]|nr:hypothetical protein [Gemmatimonadota bacterium]MDH3479024.1 hypothetical protein [Gemmatimonadota bacterium]MDH5549531.1 hypothetical protein [Gemmatimonadota bacterium]
MYAGYGVKTLPGVREGTEQCAWEETEREIARAAAALGRLVDVVERAGWVLGAP